MKLENVYYFKNNIRMLNGNSNRMYLYLPVNRMYIYLPVNRMYIYFPVNRTYIYLPVNRTYIYLPVNRTYIYLPVNRTYIYLLPVDVSMNTFTWPCARTSNGLELIMSTLRKDIVQVLSKFSSFLVCLKNSLSVEEGCQRSAFYDQMFLSCTSKQFKHDLRHRVYA